MLRSRLIPILAAAAALALVLAACENRSGDPTTDFSLGGGSTVVGVTPTPTVEPPPTSPPTPTPAPGPPGGGAPTAPPPSNGGGSSGGGDGAADAGRTVFLSAGCTACHTVDSVPGASGSIGPNLSAVASLAGSRVGGLSAQDYLLQSLEEPGAFVVDGFGPIMPGGLATGDDLDNLVAFLLTLN